LPTANIAQEATISSSIPPRLLLVLRLMHAAMVARYPVVAAAAADSLNLRVSRCSAERREDVWDLTSAIGAAQWLEFLRSL
jgi:hypothetical protein